MVKVLVVVDMQNDFIDGALGTREAVAIIPHVKNKIKDFDGLIFYTRDTHDSDYDETLEGKNLPVKHCIKGTAGWKIQEDIDRLRTTSPIDKNTFGSLELGNKLLSLNRREKIESITFIGVCTDICVISNVMITRAFLPDVPIIVDSACCAGVSTDTHNIALNAMKNCQIIVQ